MVNYYLCTYKFSSQCNSQDTSSSERRQPESTYNCSYLSTCLSIYLFIFLCIYLSICYVSIYLTIHLSVDLPIYIFISSYLYTKDGLTIKLFHIICNNVKNIQKQCLLAASVKNHLRQHTLNKQFKNPHHKLASEIDTTKECLTVFLQLSLQNPLTVVRG